MKALVSLWSDAGLSHGGTIAGPLWCWMFASIALLVTASLAFILFPAARRLNGRPAFLIVAAVWFITASVWCQTAWAVADQLFAGGLGLEGRELFWKQWRCVLACSQMVVVTIALNMSLTAMILLTACQRAGGKEVSEKAQG